MSTIDIAAIDVNTIRRLSEDVACELPAQLVRIVSTCPDPDSEFQHVALVANFAGIEAEVPLNVLQRVTVVEAVGLLEDAGLWQEINNAEAEERERLDEQNLDLAIGTEVDVIDTLSLEAIEHAKNLWAYHLDRPPEWLMNLMRSRDGLWSKGSGVVLRPPRDIGHRVLIRHREQPRLVEWHHVRPTQVQTPQ